VSDYPPEIPGLLDSIPGPDRVVRRRIVARLETLMESEQPVPARRQAPWWTRRVVAVVVAAAILAAFFAPLPHVSLFHRLVTPGGKPSTATTSPAVTSTTSTLPYPSGYVPIPAGQLVPVADLLAISFYNVVDGAALVAPPADQPVQIAVTHDAGRSWIALGGVLPLSSGQSVSSLAWTSASGGFAWGDSSLVQLYDGGRHWRAILNPPGIGSTSFTSVSVLGDSIWASLTCATNCPNTMWNPSSVWSWSSTTGWTPLSVSSRLGGAFVPEIVRLATGTDLVLAQAPTVGRVGEPSGYLFESADGGASWTRRALPCGDLTGLDGTKPQQRFEVTPDPSAVAQVVRSLVGAIVLECQGQSFMHLQPASIWSIASLEPGNSWKLQSDDLAVAGLLYPHVPRQVGVAGWGWAAVLAQMPTPGALWLEGGHGGISRSTDEGKVWQPVPALANGIRVGAVLDFVDARHGWCLAPQQGAEGLWSTTNAGATWTAFGATGVGG
jgi:hypothetical protein